MRYTIQILGAMGLLALGVPTLAQTKPVPPVQSEPMQTGDNAAGMIKAGKPTAKGFRPIFDGKTLNGWMGEKGYWQVKDGAIVGMSPPGTPHHHYLFTDKDYADFELHADVKLEGYDGKPGYNSGVCIRIAPETYDSVPGYQVDMGDGYWGCLWEEHKREIKVIDYPKAEADKIVRAGDWNHYFVRAVNHKITIYLNGVKTGEVNDEPGLLSGPIGFQLCHGGNTIASFKNLYIRTKFETADGNKINSAPLKSTVPAVPATVTP